MKTTVTGRFVSANIVLDGVKHEIRDAKLFTEVDFSATEERVVRHYIKTEGRPIADVIHDVVEALCHPGRLTVHDHNEIIAAFLAGVSLEQLATEYHRKPETIREIIRRGYRDVSSSRWTTTSSTTVDPLP